MLGCSDTDSRFLYCGDLLQAIAQDTTWTNAIERPDDLRELEGVWNRNLVGDNGSCSEEQTTGSCPVESDSSLLFPVENLYDGALGLRDFLHETLVDGLFICTYL